MSTRAALAKSPRLARADWIAAARDALIKGGEGRVKVEHLAETLGVTTGSFYWHFKNRQELLGDLLADWESTNSIGYLGAIRANAGDPDAQLRALQRVWVLELDFDPAYDAAVRDWARTSIKADKIVRRVDVTRIALVQEMYEGWGYSREDAAVRARVAYYHQVGYYAMRIAESRAERLELSDAYFRALKGDPPASRPRQKSRR
ncbi:transcriptional regulator of TetR family [alpha proteobacterium U9-1i]|nr:transcriptional regulator of TetR family [alpha proteobacterium U9-1i]